MSYADIAAKGPQQTPEEAAAPSVGGVYKDPSESTSSLIDVDSNKVNIVDSDFLNQEVKTTTQAQRLEEEAKQASEEAENKAKAKATKAKKSLRDNSDNPVYIGNAVITAVVAAGLGFGAYHKHAQGKLSWELVGLVSGAVGALGVADYFVSKWFLQNKYPTK